MRKEKHEAQTQLSLLHHTLAERERMREQAADARKRAQPNAHYLENNREFRDLWFQYQDLLERSVEYKSQLKSISLIAHAFRDRSKESAHNELVQQKQIKELKEQLREMKEAHKEELRSLTPRPNWTELSFTSHPTLEHHLAKRAQERALEILLAKASGDIPADANAEQMEEDAKQEVLQLDHNRLALTTRSSFFPRPVGLNDLVQPMHSRYIDATDIDVGRGDSCVLEGGEKREEQERLAVQALSTSHRTSTLYAAYCSLEAEHERVQQRAKRAIAHLQMALRDGMKKIRVLEEYLSGVKEGGWEEPEPEPQQNSDQNNSDTSSLLLLPSKTSSGGRSKSSSRGRSREASPGRPASGAATPTKSLRLTPTTPRTPSPAPAPMPASAADVSSAATGISPIAVPASPALFRTSSLPSTQPNVPLSPTSPISHGRRASITQPVPIALTSPDARTSLSGASTSSSANPNRYVLKYFIGLGLGPDVPKYLRHVGKLKNKQWNKRDTEQLIKSIWTARQEALRDEGSIPVHLSDFFYSFLKKKFGVQGLIAEYSYNFLDGLSRFQADPDCDLFLKILNGDVCEAVYHDQLCMISSLMTLLEKVDTGLNGRITGKLTKSALFINLKQFFPLKSKAALAQLGHCLNMDQAGNIVSYTTLFDEDSQGTQGAFAERIRFGQLDDIEIFQSKFHDRLAELDADEGGAVAIEDVHDAWIALDPEQSVEEVELALRTALDMAPQAPIRGRVQPSHLIKKLFARCMVKPAKLYDASAKPVLHAAPSPAGMRFRSVRQAPNLVQQRAEELLKSDIEQVGDGGGQAVAVLRSPAQLEAPTSIRLTTPTTTTPVKNDGSRVGSDNKKPQLLSVSTLGSADGKLAPIVFTPSSRRAAAAKRETVIARRTSGAAHLSARSSTKDGQGEELPESNRSSVTSRGSARGRNVM